jgi:cytoskeleton protein RodZ
VLVSLVLLVVLGVALFALTFVLQGGSHQSPEPKPVAQSKPAPAADPKESPRAEAKTAETGLTPVAVAAVPEPPPTVTPQATAPAVEAPTPRIFTADPAKPETTSSKPEVTPARSELTQAKPGTPAAKPETPVARYETPVVRSEVSRPKPEVAPAKPDSLPTSVTTATVPAAASPYRLVARATEKTWVRVLTDDGRVVAEEVIPAGERREWLSNRKFVVTVGNAGGVALELNGQLLPKLGPTGEVVRRVVIPAEER